MNRPKSRILIAASILLVCYSLFVYGAFHVSSNILSKDVSKETHVFSTLSDATIGVATSSFVATEEVEGTILFVGDIMLSRAIGSIMEKKQDWTYPFLQVQEVLSSADLTFGNLEGPISDKGANIGSIYSFRANPKSVEGLSFAGFDVVSIANNHMWDYGRAAFLDTLSILSSKQIAYVGGGENYLKAHTPVIRDVRGTKVAFLAYTNLLPPFLGRIDAAPSVAFHDSEQMTLDIIDAKKVADVVVVSFHFGEEYKTIHNAYQEKIAHTAVDAGASIVIGHHPHVIQDVEVYKGAYIAYSLGNFIFDQNFSLDTSKGMVVTITFKDKKIIDFATSTVQFNATFQPSFVNK